MVGKGKGLLQQRVSLGYADENIEPADETDPLTSKLGGRPLWLDTTSPIPTQTVSMCEECRSSMLLLAQIYAPLSESPYDRVVYIWSCVRRRCTGRPGAMRVIRGHLLNSEYALKLARQRAGNMKKKINSMNPVRHSHSTSATSKPIERPFDFGSVWRTNNAANVSAGGDTLFSSPLFNAGATAVAAESADTAAGRDKCANIVDTLSTAVGQLSIDSDPETRRNDWVQDSNSIQARYLEFDEEMDDSSDDAIIGERYRVEIEQALDKVQNMGDNSSCEGQRRAGSGGSARDEEDDGWTGEKYERTPFPKGTDAAFARFAAVVGRNPEQAIRYQFSGNPLLYTMNDEVARQLDYSNDCSYDDDDDDDSNNSSSRFSMESLPRCPRCNGQRVFECQLMPALLTALPFTAHGSMHSAGREDMQTASAAGGQPLVGGHLLESLNLGLEFGTVLIFVCENDCHDGNTGTQYLGQSAESILPYAGATYYEELALVQLESHSH